MILKWDFYRAVSGASGLGSVQDYFDNESQSLYLDDSGNLDTRTARVQNGDWEHATPGSQITVIAESEFNYWLTGSDWIAPTDELLFGTLNDDSLIWLVRYRCANVLSEYLKSGSTKYRDDSPISQTNLTLGNPGEETVLGAGSLFEPGAKLVSGKA